MITAETLKCTVPSANAVKEASISCVTGATNFAEMWGAFGTIFGALATTGAVIVALYQSKKANTLAREAVELSRLHHDEAIQLPALSKFTALWRQVAVPTSSSSANPYHRLSLAIDAGMAWRHVNSKQSSDRNHLDALERSIIMRIYHLEKLAFLEVSNKQWARSGLGEAMTMLILYTEAWHGSTAQERPKINHDAEKCIEVLDSRFRSFLQPPE